MDFCILTHFIITHCRQKVKRYEKNVLQNAVCCDTITMNGSVSRQNGVGGESPPINQNFSYSLCSADVLRSSRYTSCIFGTLCVRNYAYARRLAYLYRSKEGIAVIVYKEFKSLENDLGFSPRTLYALSNNLKKHYKTVDIPKRDGGTRRLSVPDDMLKKVQRSIACNILAYEPVSDYATAYKYGAAVQKNAKPHVGAKKLLKLDILHFFDSIYYSAVKDKVFTRERFSEPIRTLLTMLCYYKDVLPQGAPTSPVITNIIMRDFDEKVGAWCESRNIQYTRYCDDMTFSGDFDEKEVKQFVRDELFAIGFVLNNKKTVTLRRDKQMLVTGIVVNEKLNISAEYRRKLRQELYFCRKYGVSEHLARIGVENEEAYLKSLLGKICFVLQTSPENAEFAEYKNYICQYIKGRN